MDLQIPDSDIILSLLKQYPEGISEYSLLEQLADLDVLKMPAEHGDLSALFQAHFLLFHSLYRLRDRLWQQQAGHLDINPLAIALQPYRPSANALAEPDNLRSYYLDLTHLQQTSDDQVAEMIAGFWNRLANPQQRQQALAELGLEDPVHDDTIRQRYRELAMKHHPDRGGDSRRFLSIKLAMDELTKN